MKIYSASNRLGLGAALAFGIFSQTRFLNSNRLVQRALGGHERVRINLFAGLEEAGIDYQLNPRRPSDLSEPVSILAGTNILQEFVEAGHFNLTVGPNICVSPREIPHLLNSCQVRKILVPSVQSKLFFSSELPSVAGKIKIWASGVDISYWSPDQTARDVEEILIYYKSGTQSELQKSIETVERAGYNWSVIKYGSYASSEYLSRLNKAKAVIWLGHYESQGLAMFEAWATDRPVFVRDRSGEVQFTVPYAGLSGVMKEGEWAPAPYLVPLNGAYWNSQRELEELLSSLGADSNDFSPRATVVQSFSLRGAALEYLRIVQA